jgi:N-acyl-D-amino-acid deacylase
MPILSHDESPSSLVAPHAQSTRRRTACWLWPFSRQFGLASVTFAAFLHLAMGVQQFAAGQNPAKDAAGNKTKVDWILRGGIVIDGTGTTRRTADVAIHNGRIFQVGGISDGSLTGIEASKELDASGMIVAPGFINMLSWGTETLLHDGRGLSDIRQGVTLEVFGEGWSMGPLSPSMRRDLVKEQSDIKFDVPWTSLMGYLEHLTEQGVSPNVASFIGATTLRIHTVGYDDRRATKAELEQMRGLIETEMEQGALGIGSSLIYAPAFYANTDELVTMAEAAGKHGGLYISHIRSEGNQLLEAVDELLEIARRADVPAEIYHLKAAGESNWPKLTDVIQRVEAARETGLGITADMYNYTAGATGLNAAMPPWVQEGGFRSWRERLMDPQIRKRLQNEMTQPTDDWENLMLMAGSPERVLLVGFRNDSLKHLTGKSLAEVAKQRGTSPEITAMDLVVEDNSRVECVYFLMSEENVRRKLELPWVSFCSDSGSLAPEGVFLKSNPHPRAYGSFARLLGRYARDEKALTLEDAIRRLTSLPAHNLGLRGRGKIAAGYAADVAVFDPAAIKDLATFDQPHQLATGVQHVFVNGQAVLLNGVHTGAKPGQVVRGPGHRRHVDRAPIEVSEEAQKIHDRGYVFDGHNDLPWQMRKQAGLSFDRMDISLPQEKLHTDVPRLRKGNVGAQFWSVYVPADTAVLGLSLQQTLEQIEVVHEMCKRYPDVFQFAGSVADIEEARANGKIASLIGVEGGHSIQDSLENLRRLYKLGARYMTLTHSDTLRWADSATDDPKHGGLSAFGEEVVREMNRLGMLVDLSHVSEDTMRDALRISKAPIIYSHSSARAIADHPRNVSDSLLRLTAKNGGVVMVNFYSGFVVPESADRRKDMFDVMRKLKLKHPDDEDAYQSALRRWQLVTPIFPGNIHHVLDHIDHIARVAGVDHVGIGSDYDGISTIPLQLEDVSTYPRLTEGLLRRGYTEEEIHKIMHKNILRVFRRAEELSGR